jgi:hypothetical protein
MNKLLRLKEWLTIPDVARHLSIHFDEEVTEADVLQLGLDGHLTLSVHFVNQAVARRCVLVPIAEAERSELRLPNKEPETLTVGVQVNETEWLNFTGEVVCLHAICDLPLIGSERFAVLHEFERLTGGPPCTMLNLDGSFVRGTDGQLYQLLESYEQNEFTKGSSAALPDLQQRIAREGLHPTAAQQLLRYPEERKAFLDRADGNKRSGREGENYYPIQGLPPDSVLVVRTAALRAVEDSLGDRRAGSETSLATRERQTLLIIVGALCRELGINPAERGAAKRLAESTERFGIPVTDETIRKFLKQLEEAEGSRRK